MQNMKNKIKPRLFFLLAIAVIEAVLLGFVWFISDAGRAGFIDRFFLYYVDDVFRYCHVKALTFNPVIALNYYCKTGYALIAWFFYNVLPCGMSSLRIMNALFSGGVLFFTYELTRRLSFSKFASSVTIILLATFPVYFLLSLSTLSEVMYSFFIILALYLLYRQKYTASLFLVALLPLIRQEGLLYVFIWIYLLYKKVRIRHLIFLFVPTVFWILLNNRLLGHGIDKFIFYLPVKDPENSMASFEGLGSLARILICHPVVILSVAGLSITLGDKRYRALRICFIAHIFFLALFQIIHFWDSGGMFCREIRVLMPSIPIAALYAGKTIDWLSQKYDFRGKLSLAGIAGILIIIMGFQIYGLQRDNMVISDSVPMEQEALVKDAAGWLNRYMRKEDIKKVCVVPGALTTDKIIRRIWMYLPGYIDFYADGNEEGSILDNSVFDLATLKTTTLSKNIKCIFISRAEINNDILNGYPAIDLIKEYPGISLYFYSVVYN